MPRTEEGLALAPRVAIAITLLSAILIASIVLLAAWRTEQADLDAETQVIADRAEILSRVFAAHVERTFRQADVLARLVGDSYLAEGTGLDLQRVVHDGSIPIDVFLQVGVTDERGVLVASSVPGSKPVDLSDRAHIKVHFDRTKAPDFFVSRPLVGRVSRQPTIQYSRAIVDDTGQFRGVSVVSISPAYFARYFGPRDVGERGLVAVFGTEDRVVRARRSGSDESVDQVLPEDLFVVRAASAGQSGVYVDRSPIDRIERTMGYVPVPRLPLAVAVGVENASALQRHVERARQVWTRSGIAIAAILALSLLNVYLIRRWAASVARQASAEIRSNRLADHLSTMTEASPDGLLLVDREGCVDEVNPAFLRMAGLRTSAVAGSAVLDALRALCAHRGLELPGEMEELLRAPSPRPEDRVIARRSSTPMLVYEIRVWAVTEQEARVVSVRDITAEHEIERLKSEFVTMAAHELRTPMASVLGFSELLLTDGLTPAEQQEAALAIHRQASRLTVMLNDFLDLARVEARAGLDFRLVKLDLVQLIQRVVHEFSYVALDREVEVDAGTLERLPVLGDESKLEQVFHNLLGNAAKYSNPPSAIRIRLAVDQARGDALVEVIDQGIGMTPAELDRVFDGFYRADQSGQTVGSGLGLRLSRRIVEVHGGTIELESAPGRGTTARVRLPLASAP